MTPTARLIEGADGFLYGTTWYDTPGGIFRCSKDGALTLLQDVTLVGGRAPSTGLTKGPDGRLYGATKGNLVFSFTPHEPLRVVYNFKPGEGILPYGSLTLGADNCFYGTTRVGGTWNQGTIYKVSPSGQYTLLYSFNVNGAEGTEPMGELTLGSDGNFYGTTTRRGGINGGGTIFKITPEGILTTLYRFNAGSNADMPNGKLIETSPGVFYGTSITAFRGIVYRITTAGEFTIIKQFQQSDGATPYAGLVSDNTGNLYGCTQSGGTTDSGTVFKINASGQFISLHSFNGQDGRRPIGELLLASDGVLYGTTSQGGATGAGTLFRITTDGEFATLAHFGGGMGVFPSAPPVRIGDSLYGMMQKGATGLGSVYMLSAGRSKVLVDFNSSYGASPSGRLTRSNDAQIYGTTFLSGQFQAGLVFRFDPAAPQVGYPDGYSVIHNFTGADGKNPDAGVIQGSDGFFYGTTFAGGANNLGTVFRMSSGGTVTTLYSFSTGAGGNTPRTELIDGKDGFYYGTTTLGGAIGAGTIFRISPTGDYTVVHDLAEGEGCSPTSELSLGTDGKFYGTAYSDFENGKGTIYSLSKSGEFQVIRRFSGADGANPNGGIAFGRDGCIYGTTQRGGQYGVGVVYRIAPDGGYNVVHHFNTIDGAFPRGTLRADETGTLWGCTERGASSATETIGTISGESVPGGGGTIFRVDLPPMIPSHEVVQTAPGEVTIRATVNPQGLPTTIAVEYGADSSYGNTTTSVNAGSGNAPVVVEIPLSDLTPHSTIHYRVTAESSDGEASSNDTILALANTPPEAGGDSLHLRIPAILDIGALLVNDSDADGDTLTVVSVGQPTFGKADIMPGNRISYSSTIPNYTGNDQFTYTISDGFGGTATATVTIHNIMPTAVSDVLLTDGSPILFSSLALTQNDSDPDGDPVFVGSVSGAKYGTLFAQEDSFTYTPSSTFPGYDTLTYVLMDMYGGQSTGTVTIQTSEAFTRKAVEKGAPATGGQEGAIWKTFGIPSINNRGQIAFLAKIQTGRVNQSAVCAGSPAHVIAATGIAISAGGMFTQFRDPLIDDNGEIAFLATRAGVPSNRDTGIWKTSENVPELVVSEGDSAPSVPNAKFKAFPQIALTGDGHLVFIGEMAVGGGGITAQNRSGIWRQKIDGSLELVLRQGQSLSVGNTTRIVRTFLALAPVAGSPDHRRSFTESGDLAFRLSFTDKSEGIVVIRSGDNSCTLISVTDSALSQDTHIKRLPGSPAIDSDGHIAFRALLTALGAGNSTDVEAIIRSRLDNSVDEIVARAGSPAPSINGAVFQGFQDPLLAEGGHVAVIASLKPNNGGVTNANNIGVWLYSPERTPALIARKGDQAPGTNGAQFATFSSVSLPSARGIAFVGRLSPERGKITAKNDTGLWAQDSSGALQLIVRKGDRLPAGGTEKTVQTFAALPLVIGSPGQGASTNGHGGFAYKVTFTDGTQAIFQTFLP
ncbi:DUF7453 family protein [Verrucomicrobiota bacterium sgz303538]